jgi:hypothetical protein
MRRRGRLFVAHGDLVGNQDELTRGLVAPHFSQHRPPSRPPQYRPPPWLDTLGAWDVFIPSGRYRGTIATPRTIRRLSRTACSTEICWTTFCFVNHCWIVPNAFTRRINSHAAGSDLPGEPARRHPGARLTADLDRAETAAAEAFAVAETHSAAHILDRIDNLRTELGESGVRLLLDSENPRQPCRISD